MTRPIRQSVMCTHTVHTVQKDYAVFARMSQNILWEINWSLIKKKWVAVDVHIDNKWECYISHRNTKSCIYTIDDECHVYDTEN